MLNLNDHDLDKVILVGDRILVKPSKPDMKTSSGLYLPQGLHKKEELFSGYVMKVGPGYPIPAVQDLDEQWKNKQDEVRYVTLQPKPGDIAVYLQQSVYEIEFKKIRYVILPQSAVLLLVRDEFEV